MYPGFAFFNGEAPGVPRHLNVVVCEGPMGYLVLNLTTGRDGEGLSFTTHHWSKLDRESQVAASQARIVTFEQMRGLRDHWLWQVTESPPKSTLKAIIGEFLRAKTGKEDMKGYLRHHLPKL